MPYFLNIISGSGIKSPSGNQGCTESQGQNVLLLHTVATRDTAQRLTECSPWLFPVIWWRKQFKNVHLRSLHKVKSSFRHSCRPCCTEVTTSIISPLLLLFPFDFPYAFNFMGRGLLLMLLYLHFKAMFQKESENEIKIAHVQFHALPMVTLGLLKSCVCPSP